MIHGIFYGFYKLPQRTLIFEINKIESHLDFNEIASG